MLSFSNPCANSLSEKGCTAFFNESIFGFSLSWLLLCISATGKFVMPPYFLFCIGVKEELILAAIPGTM
jgi:hypothetical protein